MTEIVKRLDFLDQVGRRLSDARPPGRYAFAAANCNAVRLATGIGSGLVGVCYVLDEPSIGLHQRDNQRLIDALRELASSKATRCWSSSTTKP